MTPEIPCKKCGAMFFICSDSELIAYSYCPSCRSDSSLHPINFSREQREAAFEWLSQYALSLPDDDYQHADVLLHEIVRLNLIINALTYQERTHDQHSQ